MWGSCGWNYKYFQLSRWGGQKKRIYQVYPQKSSLSTVDFNLFLKDLNKSISQTIIPSSPQQPWFCCDLYLVWSIEFCPQIRASYATLPVWRLRSHVISLCWWCCVQCCCLEVSPRSWKALWVPLPAEGRAWQAYLLQVGKTVWALATEVYIGE